MTRADVSLAQRMGKNLALIGLLFLPLEARGQGLQCASRAAMVAQLLSEYAEIPVASGLQSNGALVEILTSPSGTWSIIVGKPGGLTCLVASGDGWQAAMPQVPGRGA